jgi:hypothetical protein
VGVEIDEATLKWYGDVHVGINKLRDEMAAAYRHAEAAHVNISRAKLAEFIDKINLLC